MKQQILIIHGGNAWNSSEEYLTSLQQKEVTLERLKSKDWKETLEERVGVGFEVYTPTMPCKQNAKYAEWKIYFEKVFALLNPGVILIGHSLGGIFLAKYLSEEKISKSIRATIFVAAPFNTPDIHPLADFVLTQNLNRLAQQGGSITIFHSRDDQVVPFSNAQSYAEKLPKAEKIFLENKGHFNESTFPELESVIYKCLTV